ncbi:hypothetical protein [Flavobacterium notoginsengisoli]|uniref:hypothetical protein n=1 Tax=Flavobacterium notoginsengisoli TaxID=1478199 RepID=UPI0036447F79
MTKEDFLFHLQGASFVTLKFAERYVKDKLVTDFKYNVILTVASNIDGSNKFDIYPEENDIIKLDLTEIEVVDLLYRNNKIPIWIDISVLKSSRKSTTFNLLCSGKYSNDKNDYYYNQNGSGPFGVKSPKLPINYKEGNKIKLRPFTIRSIFSK